MLKEKILPKLVLLNTRFVVGTYTALTLPFYAIAQRPWLVHREARQRRTSKERSSAGSYDYWKRHGVPVDHPSNYHLLDSYNEVLQRMKEYENLDTPRLGYREVLSEKVKYDENGNVILQDGRVLKELKLASDYKWYTLRQLFERLDNLSRGFQSHGISAQEKVLIYADTRIEWFMTALSMLRLNAIIATLFSNLGKEGLVHGMKQTKAKYVITSIDLLEKIAALIDETPNIEKIFYIRYPFQKGQALPKFPPNVQLIPFDEVEEQGKSAPELVITLPKPGDITMIMYTSGTTGIPKAVILTHKQMKAALISLVSNVIDLSHEATRHVYASFLPLAHILGFSFEMFLFTGGVRIGYSSPFTLTDTAPGHVPGQPGDLRLLKPTTLIVVPLILDRIVKEIYLKLSSRSPILPPLFTYLMDYKIRWTKRGFDTPIVNRIVCSRVQEQFGGQLEFIVCGGAPLNPRTQELVKAALNIKLFQGYGSTETTGGVLGTMRQDLHVGEAGYPLEGARIRLDSWEEGGYTLEDKPNPRGEILVGGDSVAEGYYKLDQETKDTFFVDEEGVKWFRSGDIGEVMPSGSVKIVDRKKDLAKLPNGEYVSLGKIESIVKTVNYVENCCICLSQSENYLTALVTPSPKNFKLLASELGKSHMTKEELCKDSKVYQIIYDAIREACTENNLAKKEIPIKIHICAEEWVPDNELLTAAFKLKRNNVLKFYQKEVAQMFQK